MSTDIEVVEIVDALKGGPKTCPYCGEQLNEIMISGISTARTTETWEWNSQYCTYEWYDTEDLETIDAEWEFIYCPHCQSELPDSYYP